MLWAGPNSGLLNYFRIETRYNMGPTHFHSLATGAGPTGLVYMAGLLDDELNPSVAHCWFGALFLGLLLYLSLIIGPNFKWFRMSLGLHA